MRAVPQGLGLVSFPSIIGRKGEPSALLVLKQQQIPAPGKRSRFREQSTLLGFS